jgi:methionine biosynthesis protein MetW
MINKNIDIPGIDDNREYDYSNNKTQIRAEYEHILNFVSNNAKVIDLGCGNGSLLELLKEKKNAETYGIELSQSGVDICRAKELNVLHGRIDVKLDFEDKFFDYAISNVTIQMVMYPEVLISEMKRISKYLIISFPNFAFYRNRLDLLINGKMPTSTLFGYKWYDTGHLHQFSINDFLAFIEKREGLKIRNWQFVPNPGGWRSLLMKHFPNLFQVIPIFLLESE